MTFPREDLETPSRNISHEKSHPSWACTTDRLSLFLSLKLADREGFRHKETRKFKWKPKKDFVVATPENIEHPDSSQSLVLECVSVVHLHETSI